MLMQLELPISTTKPIYKTFAIIESVKFGLITCGLGRCFPFGFAMELFWISELTPDHKDMPTWMQEGILIRCSKPKPLSDLDDNLFI